MMSGDGFSPHEVGRYLRREKSYEAFCENVMEKIDEILSTTWSHYVAVDFRLERKKF